MVKYNCIKQCSLLAERYVCRTENVPRKPTLTEKDRNDNSNSVKSPYKCVHVSGVIIKRSVKMQKCPTFAEICRSKTEAVIT